MKTVQELKKVNREAADCEQIIVELDDVMKRMSAWPTYQQNTYATVQDLHDTMQ